jgi:hypothetical protein
MVGIVSAFDSVTDGLSIPSVVRSSADESSRLPSAIILRRAPGISRFPQLMLKMMSHQNVRASC